MSDPKILIACVGNIFLGDDGFGVEVARRMTGRSLPAGAVVKDFGIRGFDLTYALMDSYDLVILVDACPRGGDPGSIYVIEPDPVEKADQQLEIHGMSPLNVLRTVRSMGGAQNRILIVGCEPFDLVGDEGKLGLSEPVMAAIDEAVATIERLIDTASRPEEIGTLCPHH